MRIRDYVDEDFAAVAAIINDGAQAYRGQIPATCWHEPYMDDDALVSEIRDGVRFAILEVDAQIRAVMGLQDRGEVVLIRHAYVATACQRRGYGRALLDHLGRRTHKPVLIGTWAAARWAIDFYCKHGFTLCDRTETVALLERYWRVPPSQVDNSVVLSRGLKSRPVPQDVKLSQPDA